MGLLDECERDPAAASVAHTEPDAGTDCLADAHSIPDRDAYDRSDRNTSTWNGDAAPDRDGDCNALSLRIEQRIGLCFGLGIGE